MTAAVPDRGAAGAAAVPDRGAAGVDQVVVHPDAESLAQAVAARLVVRLIDAQAQRGTAAVVLTGGRIADAVHRAVRVLPAARAVDWSQVDVWWGDERFLPAGHPDRNETQARDALLDGLPLDPRRVHPMPASDGPYGPDAEAAAEAYAAALREAGEAYAAAPRDPAGPALPRFDVLMLGLGEDGHVASVFPGHPVLDATGPVSAVRSSPKPPPTRITLTLPTINTADEVWVMAAGPDKAEALGRVLGDRSDQRRLPAALVAGVTRTRWLVDRQAAAALPLRDDLA